MPNQIGPWIDVRSFAPNGYGRTGASSERWDKYIQSAINYIVDQGITTDSGTLYLPPGRYRLEAPLQVKRIIKTGAGNPRYGYCSIRIVGDAPGYGSDDFHGTALIADFCEAPALIIQSGRAVSIENITFVGKNNWEQVKFKIDAKTASDMETHYKDSVYVVNDCRDTQYSPYAGVHIDPFCPKVEPKERYPTLSCEYLISSNDPAAVSAGGSSKIFFRSCEFRQFVVGVGISLNGHTQNAEDILLEDCTIVSVKSGIAVGQDQSRNVTVRNLSCYGARVAFDCINYGERKGDCPSIFGANIGGTKYAFQTFSIGGEASVNGLFAESLYSIGILGAGGATDGHVFNACSFHFNESPSNKPAIRYRLGNMANTIFNGCTFSMRTNDEPMWMYNSGALTFNNCKFATPERIPVSPFWINGSPERVQYNNCTSSMTPHGATLSQILPVDYKTNLYDYPMIPGTLFHAIHDASPAASAPLRWVSSMYPRVFLGDQVEVSVDPNNGTASFQLYLPDSYGKVAVGDFIWSYSGETFNPYAGDEVSYKPGYVGDYAKYESTVVIGKVDILGPNNTVTLAYVPVASDGINPFVPLKSFHHLYAMYLPRVHVPTTGTITFDSNGQATKITNLTPKPPDPTPSDDNAMKKYWAVNERIRDKQGAIAEGTYIDSIAFNQNGAINEITLSRPAIKPKDIATNPISVNLYDAEVHGIGLKQIY